MDTVNLPESSSDDQDVKFMNQDSKSHLHVNCGLRPSSSGQSTDSGIVVDADQDPVWNVVGQLKFDQQQQQHRWESSHHSVHETSSRTKTAHFSPYEPSSSLDITKKFSEVTLGASSSSSSCHKEQACSSSRQSITVFDRQMKSNFLEAKLRVEESLQRLQMCKTFKDFQAEFVGTGRAIVDLACLAETKVTTTVEEEQRRASHFISDVEIATRFGIRIKVLSNKCCHEVERCQRSTQLAKYDHLILGVKKIAVLAWKTYLFTRAEPPLMTSTDLFRSVYETALVASSCSECVDLCLSQVCNNRLEIKTFSAQIRSLCDDIKKLMRSDAQGRDAVFQKVLMALEGMCSILELIKDLLFILHKSELNTG